MKPFSKFEAISGKPVVTRSGKKVTQLKEFAIIGPYQIAGVVEGKRIDTWSDDGKYFISSDNNPLDLFMETAVHEGWVAFGPEVAQTSRQLVAFATHVWPTEATAVKSYKDTNYDHEPKGTVRISWEE